VSTKQHLMLLIGTAMVITKPPNLSRASRNKPEEPANACS